MIQKVKNLSLILASTLLFACNGTENDDTPDIQLDDSLFNQEYTASDIDHSQEDGLSDAIVGTYKGNLPCLDCEGIETTVVLNKDGSYEKSEQFITDKVENQTPSEDKGMIDLNMKDSLITLISTVNTSKLKYKLGKNEIQALNLDGKEVTGELADDFTLTKE